MQRILSRFVTISTSPLRRFRKREHGKKPDANGKENCMSQYPGKRKAYLNQAGTMNGGDVILVALQLYQCCHTMSPEL